MYDTPITLHDSVIDFICENIEALCREEPVPRVDVSLEDNDITDIEVETEIPVHGAKDGEIVKQAEDTKLVFRDADACFHTNISEQLLTRLSEKGKLTEKTITLFDPNVTTLRKVALHDAPVTARGLQVLKSHKVTELEATAMKKVAVNDLVECLSEWSHQNLRVLNVSRGTFLTKTNLHLVCALTKLRNLQVLNVSYTEFNQHGLALIAQDLPSLENLDISCTYVSDITPLLNLKDKIKYLSMYNVQISPNDNVVELLHQFHNLRHLDISDDISIQPFMNLQKSKVKIADILTNTACLPLLNSLDISGKEGITTPFLSEFLLHHRGIQFLGLAMIDACESPIFTQAEFHDYRPDITVTGDATEKQLIESLRRYPLRAVYVQKTLYSLFTLTQDYQQPRLDIIQLILPSMKNHPKQLGVQMAATACLYYLTRSDLGQKIHPRWLAKVVSLTLDSMESFPKHQQLQKNTLLTLCSDRILQEVSFDRFRCARLVMECLCSFDEPSMNRMCVAICSILAAKISTLQTSKLGAQPEFMKKLLVIVDDKSKTKTVDVTMKFSLSALWNLTDESPVTCVQFLSEGGLELFTNVLELYSDTPTETRVQVETKVLGLLNNIAEVSDLRKSLMTVGFISRVRRLLTSPDIEVSYFAAGIVAHLVSDGSAVWKLPYPLREELVQELYSAVCSWKQPDGEMVAYRSFSPFFNLLRCKEIPAVQLWAVWAVHHVCTRNGSRYCAMLVEEDGRELLQDLIDDPSTDPDVVRISKDVLGTLVVHQT